MGDCCSKPTVADDYGGTLQKLPSRALAPDEVRVHEVQVILRDPIRVFNGSPGGAPHGVRNVTRTASLLIMLVTRQRSTVIEPLSDIHLTV